MKRVDLIASQNGIQAVPQMEKKTASEPSKTGVAPLFLALQCMLTITLLMLKMPIIWVLAPFWIVIAVLGVASYYFWIETYITKA